MQIGDQDSVKKLWDAIRIRNVGADRVKEARLQTLMSEFDHLRMTESETIDTFAGKLFGIASTSLALGETIEESKLVKKFLKSLLRNFIHIVASLEQENRGLYSKSTGDGGGSSSGGAGTSRFHDGAKGKWKGARGLGGYSQNNGSGFGSAGSSGSNGPKSNCTPQGNKTYNSKQAQEKVIPSQYDSQDNDVWYLDNAVSNHMTGNRSFFSQLDEGMNGRVKFEDNPCVKIKGKGAILFQGKRGQQRPMKEIYYISDLKNDIISLGQATEVGYDIRMKDNYLTIHDADN
ncbi:uncharacterized protein LOC128133397 [Lactuca sativa]|uniref:uncharacterized protein LOC128133397 n=1 Tax=Lactuca sativa TaxID=4236 RepID=UPI0022AF56A6|nr:uncharacterized protein LOC128133397 [Lactuca sativa]